MTGDVATGDVATGAEALPLSLGPDLHTRAPQWVLPKGATDTHFHVFGPQDRFPFSPRRRYDAPDAPIEQWWAMAAVCGIDRGVAVTGSVHGSDNAPIIDAIARSDGRLRGVAKVDADTPYSELEQMKAAGVVGARFSILSDRSGTIDEVQRAAPVLAELGWSMDLHLSADALLENEAIVRGLPVPVVIDHMANLRPSDGLDHPAMQLLLDLVATGNVWVKVAAVHKRSAIHRADVAEGATPYTDVVERARVLVERAPDRVLWGTDYPHANIYDPRETPNEGDLLDVLALYAPDDQSRQKLLVDNPAQLYGFDV